MTNPIGAGPSDFDPWTRQTAHPPKISVGRFHIETISEVQPLDAQFGAVRKKSVPDALFDILFGKIDTSGADQDGYPQTYAILDAAKIPDLREYLERSTLEYRCLFKGQAYDDLSDVAPWIIRLDLNDQLTRYLFTDGEAPWFLWRKEPGVYVRSYASLEDLWKHFRRFTRVRDENGNWLYQRFREPGAFQATIQSTANPFVNPQIVSSIARHDNKVQIASATHHDQVEEPVIMTSADRGRYADLGTRRFARDLADRLLATSARQRQRLGLETARPLADSIYFIANKLAKTGIVKSADVGRICVCGFFYGTSFLDDPRVITLARTILANPQVAPSVRALRFEEQLRARPRHRHVTSQSGLRQALADLEQLRENGRLPPVPPDHAGLQDVAMHALFVKRCKSSWLHAGLPAEEISLRQRAFFRLSLLWTPFFLTDPLHNSVSQEFYGTDPNDLSGLIGILRSRLNGG